MSNASSSQRDALPVVPWKPWLGVLFLFFVFFASQILGGLLVTIYPLTQGWSAAHTTKWLADSTGVQFTFIVITETLSIGSIYLFLKQYKLSLTAIGLRRPRWSDLGYGVAAVPFYFVSYLIVVAVVSHFVPSLNVGQEQQLGFDNVAGTIPLIMTFISLVILPPLAEEIMVRGFLYGTLKKALPLVSAALVTSALFAAAHLSEGGDAGPLYIAALDTFVLSLVLIWLREKTQSLWAPITLHAIKNGIAFTLLFVLHTV